MASDPFSDSDGAGPLWKRLMWLIAIWTASVAALGVVAGLLRWWLHA